jgi:hypothetical protein
MNLFKDTLIEDYILGALYGLGFIFLVGAWCIPILVLTSLLWGLGGKYGHAIRVFGIPIASYGIVWLLRSHSILALVSGALTGAVFSLGYGIPTTQPPDEGSGLGRFFYNLFNKNNFLANLFTRGTIYLLLAISSIHSFFIPR